MSLASLARIERMVCDGLHQTYLQRAEGAELFATATPLPGDDLPRLLERLGRAVRHYAARPVALTIIAPPAACTHAPTDVATLLGPIQWPITWVTPEDCGPGQGLGVELHAVHGLDVEPIHIHGRVVGSVWEDAGARYCELGDLRASDVTLPPAQQTQRVLEDTTAALDQAGMTFRHVYRTWFRNRDILGWYREFNRVRTAYYAQLQVFEGLLPASTGIGAGNPFGAALTVGLLAMEPKTPGIEAATVESPLQDAARKYGSAFSRAVEVDLGDHRRLTISGTASIDWAGATVHIGDVAAQVDLTMRVVGALLEARGMDWADLTRALAYFRCAADVPAYRRWEAARGLGPLPVIVGAHTVCRDDLLYEIEVDALTCG